MPYNLFIARMQNQTTTTTTASETAAAAATANLIAKLLQQTIMLTRAYSIYYVLQQIDTQLIDI